MKDQFKKAVLLFFVLIPIIFTITSCNKTGKSAGVSDDNAERIKHGEYLVKITGCNDCHTPGYIETHGKTPVENWLVGTSIGWHGPWGTTYPINLRLLVDGLDEKQWMEVARNMNSRPPMPWWALVDMTDEDLIDMFSFIKSLGPAGEAAPAYIPPGQQPKGPYISFPSP